MGVGTFVIVLVVFVLLCGSAYSKPQLPAPKRDRG